MTREVLSQMLAARLDGGARAELERQIDEIAGGVDDSRFAALLSRASRFAPRGALDPTDDELCGAAEALEGWNPERWRVLEAWRVALVLARSDLREAGAERAIEEAFLYADEGEARALYRSLAHLPEAQRFVWRAGEGCRTNIVPVFEAVATDTPFPFRYFDDVAWNQLAIKAVFIGAPLWRVFGLDRRLSPELARMALDLVDERRSAGREIQPELWLCLGEHGDQRGLAALERELEQGSPVGRSAAAVALARAGETERLARFVAEEPDAAVGRVARAALDGAAGQEVFRTLGARVVPA